MADTERRDYLTYGEPSDHQLSRMCHEAPYCFNGWVGVRRWRITVEPISEPHHVLCARLEMLWRTSDNHHDMQPLRAAAKELGYTFTGEWGSERRACTGGGA